MSNLINFYFNKINHQNHQSEDLQNTTEKSDENLKNNSEVNDNLIYPLDYKTPPKNIPIHSYTEKYQVISSLGNGSFGTVELAKLKHNNFELLKLQESQKKGTMMDPLEESKYNLANNLVAIKTMKKKLPLLKDYTRVKELKFIMSIPSHPCLVQIYEVFIDDIDFQLHISMEALNQNLYQLMKSRRSIKFSPLTLKSILSQLLCAIKHIHNYNFFHRDVKPENILVIPTLHFYGSKSSIPPYRKNDNFIIKLGDYGLARHVTNMNPYTAYVSTRWYRSPEILLRQKHYSRPIDIWAFGVVAAEIANFIPLFPGSNELDQIWKILKVLGSPSLPQSPTPCVSSSSKISPMTSHNYIVPLGGYWSDAVMLANKLGIFLPMELGLTIDEIINHPDSSPLKVVIQSCLMWNPSARPDANEISKMEYFKDTIALMENYFDSNPSSSILSTSTPTSSCSTKSRANPSSTTSSSYNYQINYNTLNKLVGIPNSPSRKILSPSHQKPRRISQLPNSLSVYQDFDDGYENYFSEYIISPKDDSNSDLVSNTTTATIADTNKKSIAESPYPCGTWISKFKNALSPPHEDNEQQQSKPRSFNKVMDFKSDSIEDVDHEFKITPIGTKRSFTTFSFENDEFVP